MRKACSYSCLLIMCLCFGRAAAAAPALDPPAPDSLETSTTSVEGAAAIELLGGTSCESIGDLITGFNRNMVYRGNLFRVDKAGAIAEFGFELKVSDGQQVDLYFSIHEGPFETAVFDRSAALPSDVVLSVTGDGLNTVYTTGTLPIPVPLVPGRDYVLGVAWGSTSVRYGRDNTQGPNTRFESFPNALYIGAVSRTLVAGEPPLDPSNEGTILLAAPNAPWSMVICLAGACCLPDDTCTDVPALFCLEQGGEFTAPGTSCLDLDAPVCPLEQGACCLAGGTGCLNANEPACMFEGGRWFQGEACTDLFDPCEPRGGCCTAGGGCIDDIPEQRCIVEFGGQWRGEGGSCDDFPPCTAGACCSGAACGLELTAEDCLQSGGLFAGYGSNCDSDPCASTGACCLTEQTCADDMSATSCDAAGGIYRGDWTFCDSLACAQRGACCVRGLGCLDDWDRTNCEGPLSGTYQGDGTECATLSPPCQGNCCWDLGCISDFSPVDCGGLPFGGADGVFIGYDNPSPCQSDPDYCTTMVTPGACCLSDGECILATNAACLLVSGVYRGDGTDCAGLDPPCDLPAELGACCLPGGECAQMTQSDCEDASVGGVYMGASESCEAGLCVAGACCSGVSGEICTLIDPVACPGSFSLRGACVDSDCPGACCMPDESCDGLTQVACDTAGGNYHGDGVACGVDGCAPVTCCFSDDSCDDTLVRLECERLGGVEGGGPCGPDACPPFGACCLTDGSCQRLTEAGCATAEGAYAGDGGICSLAPDTCATGACCALSGLCDEDRLVFECTNPGEEYHDGLTCAEVAPSCEPRGACCVDQACTTETEAGCATLAGTFLGVGIACDPNPCAIAIAGSMPPNGAIDAGQPTDPDGSNPDGWDSIDIDFDGPTAAVVAGDFTVDTTDGTVLNIISAVPGGNSVALAFDAIIPLQEWTRITHDPSGTSVCLGYLPGDVNGDGTTSPPDILAVIDSLNGVVPLPDRGVDVDRSTVPGPPDILRVIDLLNGAGSYAVWFNATLPPTLCVP